MEMVSQGKNKKHSIGLFLLFLYVLLSYIATDIVISTKYQSYALYIYLAWGAIATIINILNHGGKLQLNIYSQWYFLFFFLGMLMMLYSPEIKLFSGVPYMMIVAAVLTFFIFNTIEDEDDFQKICWFYSISAVGIIIILFFTGNLTATANNRLGSEVYGNSNTFAEKIMIAEFLEIWLLQYGSKKKVYKLFLLFALIIETYSLFLSGGRKCIIVPLLFLYILSCTKTDSKGRHKIIKATIITVALITIIWLLITRVPLFYDIVGRRMQLLINGFSKSDISMGASADIRARMRETAFQGWLKSPLFGHGFDSYKYYGQSAVGKFAYSHCNYTEMLYNGGVIGFASYYYIYYYLFKVVLKKNNFIPVKYRAFVIATLISLLVYDYGCVTYFGTEIQILLMLVCRVVYFRENDWTV